MIRWPLLEFIMLIRPAIWQDVPRLYPGQSRVLVYTRVQGSLLREKLHFTTFGVMTTKLSPYPSCPQEGGPRSWTQTDDPLPNYPSAGVPCTILATLGEFPSTQPLPSGLQLAPFAGKLPVSEAFGPNGLDHLSSACISWTYRSFQDYFVLPASCLFGLHVLWAYRPGPCSFGWWVKEPEPVTYLSASLVGNRLTKPYTSLISASRWLNGKSYSTRAGIILAKDNSDVLTAYFAKDNHGTATILFEV